MNKGKAISAADFEKAWEEMYKAGIDNNQAIVNLAKIPKETIQEKNRLAQAAKLPLRH